MTRLVAIYAALATTLFLATLDQTAVVTALPRIVSDVGGFSSYSWVVTAYVLAMTVVVPVYGKLVDVYGPRRLLVAAIAVFTAGSLLCAAAQTMTHLVLARVLQGLGGGGLFPVAHAAVGLLAPPRERGRYAAILGATYAAAGIGGPAVGGALADGPGWRWIFLLNLPFGVLSAAAILFAMEQRAGSSRRPVDWAGAGLAAAWSGLFLLMLVWGGHEYAWASPPVLLAGAGALVAALVFVAVERRAREPILPFALLRLRAVAVGVGASTLLGMAMLGTAVFYPLFAQGVLGESAAGSGVLVIAFMLSAVVASVAAAQVALRTGRYKASIVAGFALLVAGLALSWRMDEATTAGELYRNVVIGGVGIGLCMQLLGLAVQNAVPIADMGGATALLHFVRQLGGAVGVTAMGVIAARDLPKGLDLRGGPVPEDVPPGIARALADALQPSFLFALCVCVAALAVAVILLREEPLRRKAAELGSLP